MLWLLPQDFQMSEVKKGGILQIRVEVAMALIIFKQAATRFASCKRGSKVMVNNQLYF